MSTRITATPELKKEFAKRLLERLAQSDLNQSELARRINVSKDAVSTYARGRSLPSPQTLLRISKVLGCDPADLLPKRFDKAALASPLRMTMLEDGRVSLEIQVTVTFDKATQIMELLRDEAIHAE